MTTIEERLEDAERRINELEQMLDEFTNRLRVAANIDMVNVAGGIAYNALHGGD